MRYDVVVGLLSDAGFLNFLVAGDLYNVLRKIVKLKVPLIKVEDIIRYLSFVKSRPGMSFQPQDSYDVATAHAWGFLTAAYFDCLENEHIHACIHAWYLRKMKIEDCSCALEYIVKMNNAELTEKELIQKFFDILIEYFTEL